MTEFYAQPYSIEHTGFTFNSFETFEAGMEKLNKRGCEEVEIQFIDGDIAFWFDVLDDFDLTEATPR